MIRVNLPIYVPKALHEFLRKTKAGVRKRVGNRIDLHGDREIEWSFIISRLSQGPGEVLDFGASFGNLSIAAAHHGFHVLALDLGCERFPWKHPNVDFLQADLLQAELPKRHFDFILNCSSIEHVGLQGRYGVAAEETDGDLTAMARFAAGIAQGIGKYAADNSVRAGCSDRAVAPSVRREAIAEIVEGI